MKKFVSSFLALVVLLFCAQVVFAVKTADLIVYGSNYDSGTGDFSANGFVAKPIIYTLDKKGGITGTTGNEVVVEVTVDGGEYTCEWDTVTGGMSSMIIHHSVTRSVMGSIGDAVTATGDARKNSRDKVTGYLWSASGTVDAVEALPSVGDSCDPVSEGGMVTSVTSGAGATMKVTVVDINGNPILIDDTSTGGNIGDPLQIGPFAI